MTPTKTARTLQASTSNAAGATATGSTLDLTTKFGGLATLIVTNGGTGPTVGCDAIIEISRDNSSWQEYARFTAGVTLGVTYTFHCAVPDSVLYCRSKFTGNTGQAVTVEAYLHELTSIS